MGLSDKKTAVIAVALLVAVTVFFIFFHDSFSGAFLAQDVPSVFNDTNEVKLGSDSNFADFVYLELARKKLAQQNSYSLSSERKAMMSKKVRALESEPKKNWFASPTLMEDYLLPYADYFFELEGNDKADGRAIFENANFKERFLFYKESLLSPSDKQKKDAFFEMHYAENLLNFIELTRKIGVFERAGSENKRLLEALETVDFESVTGRKKISLLANQLKAFEFLDNDFFKYDVRKGEYLKNSKLEEICSIPSFDEVFSFEDPCLWLDFLSVERVCNPEKYILECKKVNKKMSLTHYREPRALYCQSLVLSENDKGGYCRKTGDYTKEYLAAFDSSGGSLSPHVVIGVIKQKGVDPDLLKADISVIQQKCSNWEQCSACEINEFILLSKADDPSFKPSSELEKRVKELYSKFKEDNMSKENRTFSREEKCLLSSAGLLGLISTDEKTAFMNAWISSLTAVSEYQSDYIWNLVFLFGVKNIEDLKEKAKENSLPQEKIERIERILCDGIPSLKSGEITADLNTLIKTWRQVLRKGFCKKELTEYGEKRLRVLLPENYFRVLESGEFSYKGEFVKYCLANQEKIFK